jgi:RHS repeat-associated protein
MEENLGSFTPQTSYPLVLGQGWIGGIDELSLYTRALSMNEVQAIYAAGSSGKSPIDDNQPPVVTAGPDLRVSAANSVAALLGSVRDDGHPMGGALTSKWRKLDGPGEPQFGDSTVPNTTVTFPVVGTYILELSASDGMNQSRDTMVAYVGLTNVDADSSLAAWWPGNGEVHEMVHGGHDLEFLPSGVHFMRGQVSEAFDLGGGSANAAAHPDLDIGASTQGFTIEFWARPTQGQDATVLGWTTGSSTGVSFVQGGQYDYLYCRIYDTAGQSHNIDARFYFTNKNVWTHVAFTYDRATGTARLYQNGALWAEQNLTVFTPQTSYPLVLGPGWQGGLDEISLYTKPLTPAQIQAIYQSWTAGKTPIIPNVAPIVNAGADVTAYVNAPVVLNGGVVDDGLPNPPSAVTQQWSKVSGPGNVSFTNGTSAVASASFDAPGTYVLRLTVSDSVLVASDDVTVTIVNPPPSVQLTAPTPNTNVLIGQTVTLRATATAPAGGVAKVEFFDGTTKLGQATAPDAGTTNVYSFGATFLAGSHVLTARVTDGAVATATSGTVSIKAVAYAGESVIKITAPTDTGRLSAPTDVMGIVADSAFASWTVVYRLKAAEGAAAESWRTLATGTSLVGVPAASGGPETPGKFGTFDPTSLINGIYELQLLMTDTSGTTTAVPAEPISVMVEGNMKVGVFSLAFEDLKVPVAGIPITATRTYDSRDTRVGDFGPGWRLAVANVRVQKNRPLGTGWFQTFQSGNGIQFYNVDPVGDRIVTVAMPDGETHRFKIGAYVKNRSGDPDDASFAVVVTQGNVVFYPIGDTSSKLEPVDANNQVLSHFYIWGTGDQSLMTGDMLDSDAVPFNTSRYRLTTKDGTIYVVDEALGLISVSDLSGNTLVVNRDGQNRVTSLVSTLNQPTPLITSITIHRDGTGRVDYIRDPAGKDVDYLYDTQGRLSSFTNRTLDVTQFYYENPTFPYYLTRIVDPRGVNAIRTEFDANGKMIKQIDAAGKETVFTHAVDQASRSEKVKDRLGNETTFFYDDRGNVTSKIDPLGGQTTYSYYPDTDRVKLEMDHYGNVKSMAYDAHGNVVVQTVGADASDDPAAPTKGHTTRTDYNAASAPTRITDADGRSQTFTYDPATNNLLTQTVGAGGVSPSTTTFAYNPDGTLKTQTDPLGDVTSYAYVYGFSDSNYPGAVKKVTVTVIDPAGATGADASNASDTILRVTSTLYDAQENQIAQIVTRHLPDGSSQDVVTRYVYDTENRLRATILADGRVNETRYNAIGKTDKSLEWQSTADYQARDTSKARVTAYGYDTRGNETSVTYADGTSEQMHYDAEGRKDWSQDRRGYRTFFVYDAVGRLTSTILPDADDGIGVAAPSSVSDSRLKNNPTTSTVYDLAGRVTDSYDEMGRHTQTVYYPDGTADAGRRKQLVQVRALGNLVTSYQYDGAGNVRYVTDARGNTTESQYDDQGRIRYTIFPATDEHPSTRTETQYDTLGRRSAVVDQEGRITRYRYDGLGRLIEVRQYLDQSIAAGDAAFNQPITAASVVSTRYAYDEAGNQIAQTDALGRTTTFWTDAFGRRTKRVLPSDSNTPATSETLQYDGWGNLWKRTDFAGKTTSFAYDALNRLKSKSADPTHPSLTYSNAAARLEYDYDADGGRKAARTYTGANVLLYSETTPRDERGRVSYKDTNGGRLSYTYYANNLLNDVVSSNSNGVNVGYRYDEANRLVSVDDGTTGALHTSSFTYNANGSLETMTQPNAVVHTYNYDALNRLRGLIVSQLPTGSSAPTILHAYEYKLNPSGHRRQIIEGNRTTTYDYDPLYRLTGETIAGDTHGNNGAIGYTLDKVGNRLSRTSQLGAVNAQQGLAYNARDWLSTDTYDANGNTLTSTQLSTLSSQQGGIDTYDFENRLIVRTKPDGSTVNITYDADGNRINKTLLDASSNVTSTTTFLVDTNNLTGYAQVVEERTSILSGVTLKVYTYGNQLISQATTLNNQPSVLSYYAFDGHSNVRELTGAAGSVTDHYDYDAFGNLLSNSGTTSNAYLYCSEQFDSDLGLYNLRARYMSPDSGRFWSMDDFGGEREDPETLHKYLYAHSNPLYYCDPTGHFSLGEVLMSMAANSVISAMVSVAFNWNKTGSDFWESIAKDAGIGAVTAPIGGAIARGLAPLAKIALAPLFRVIGDLQPILLTGGKNAVEKIMVNISRFFVRTTSSYPSVESTMLGKIMRMMFPAADWEMHHVAIQQSWTRAGSAAQIFANDPAANEGLRRLANAGFNLVPIPAALNNMLGKSPAGTKLFAAVYYGTAVFGARFVTALFDDDDTF